MIANKPEITEYNGKTPLKGKRERFAQEIAKGDCNHTEAARKANYRENKGLIRYAHKLTIIPTIKARIAYLRAQLAKKYDITRESQVRKYWEVVDVCDESGDMANKNKALNSIDKLFGLSIDKQQTEQTASQQARSAVEDAQSKRYAKWCVMDNLRQQRESEAVTEVVLNDI